MSDPRPIGVFDSGVGGLSVLRALRAALPAEDMVYWADTAHAPYGERGDAYVIDRSFTVTEQLRREHGIKALVVACNTATAAAIHLLRERYPELPLVGVEPALKPAAQLSQTRQIGVLATRGTLASAKFRALHDRLADQAHFHLQACDGLADAIERDDGERIAALCQRYLGALGPLGQGGSAIDTVVLGCTHYPFAQATLQALAGPSVRLGETGEPVARQTHRLLEASALLRPMGAPGSLVLTGNGSREALLGAARRWLGPIH